MAGKNAGDIVTAPGETSIQTFTANGAWAKPNGVRAVRVRVIGGGGGGGGIAFSAAGQANSAGGGGGGYSEQYIVAANLLNSEPVTVGAAGAAGASGVNTGGTGGTSSFGTHCTATGGTGGQGMTSGAGPAVALGGVGGVGSGGDVNVAGSDGGNGFIISSAALRYGNGGASVLGGMTRQSTTVNNPRAGVPYGGGGTGVFTNAASGAGSAGAAGVVIVESIF